ncbi:PLP-dependent lyase/thiolase [Candidatus Gracilibacteria bacterium]|nr:PLP-dependent lyase/thiolase [Candidatus Gracilibacteria bacterium]
MSTKSFNDFVDPSRKDIWRYAKLLEDVKEGSQIDAKQVDFTPIEKVANSPCKVKREDVSITGSHKFRSLAYQLSCLRDRGTSKAVLSSSGNAAIAASKLLPENANLKLLVFLSKKTPSEKLAAIKFTKNLIPILSSRPLRLAKYTIKHFNLKDLRPSKDPNATIGFRSLGFEIFEQVPRIKNIFSFVTSGASICGIAEAYEFLMKSKIIKEIPQLFAVNSSGQLAGSLNGHVANKNLYRVDTSRQNNLSSGQPNLSSGHRVDKKFVEWTAVDTSRQKDLSSGQAVDKKICRVDISDTEILSIQQKYPQLETSNEGLASLAAAEKVKPKGETLVILTGRAWSKEKPDLNKFFKAENFADVDKIITRHNV